MTANPVHNRVCSISEILSSLSLDRAGRAILAQAGEMLCLLFIVARGYEEVAIDRSVDDTAS